MSEFKNTTEFASLQDQNDALKSFKSEFYFPIMDGKEVVYFTGNSLGLQPKITQDYILAELEDWATYGVEGHFHGRNPWYSYQDILTNQLATLLGANPDEVVAMNSLTTNLHLLLVSFYRPTEKRYKIICEYDAFPSDLYALQSQASFHGFDPNEAVVMIKAHQGEYTLKTEDIISAIEKEGSELATVMLGAVNYYTGQFLDLEKIVKAAHKVGATVGFNLAHAAGNVMLKLHDWQVDYACFCSYKYLNAGPGGVSGIFVHLKHADDKSLPKFAGWWGNDPETRFTIPRTFISAHGARSWQLSNAPVLPMAALKASLDIFEDAGLDELRAKSIQLTAYLEFILKEINQNYLTKFSENALQIITPTAPDERGCQLSFIVFKNGKEIHRQLADKGFILDWREPDVIRAAPVPLYNSFSDIFEFGKCLSQIIMIDK